VLLTCVGIAFEGILVFDTEVPSGLVPQFLVAEFVLEESFGKPTMFCPIVQASDKSKGVSVVVFNSQGRTSQPVV
jgi:hypothetical protein